MSAYKVWPQGHAIWHRLTCHAEIKCRLTRQNFLFNVGKIPNFFALMMRDRFLPQYMIELCTKESLILVKAHSKFLLITVYIYLWTCLASHLMDITTSKVLQTDSAYLPESLVRFLLIVQYEMLLSWPLGSPVVTYYYSTATNTIGLQTIPLHGP
jgi:hypothetical protein